MTLTEGIEYKSIRIETLIDAVESGGLALPEFQREFIWGPSQVAELLRTYIRRWPMGSFLILENRGPGFQSKQITGAPKPKGIPAQLLLDGQQRMTALFQAISDLAQDVYVVDMGALQAAADFEDEHLRYVKRSIFVREFSTLKELADARVAPLNVLKDARQFHRWTNYLPQAQQEAFFEVKEQKMPGLSSYDIPVIEISQQVPLGVVAKVFETLNKTGVRLGAFDLEVANLYPHGFKLRDKWEEAKAAESPLREFEVEGIEVLKLIALHEHLRQAESGSKVTVKGIRESDVLDVTPRVILADWDAAVRGLSSAYQLGRTHFGVIRPNLVPSSTMFLPIANVMFGGAKNLAEEVTQRLEKWFWASVFRQTYSQGANTQAVADAKALRAWVADPMAVPAVLGDFSSAFDKTALLDIRKRNEIAVRGACCLLVKRGARDWITDKPLDRIEESLEVHHIFAKGFLETRGRKDPNIIANLTVISGASNAALRNDHPKAVVNRQDVVREAIGTHKVDLAKMTRENYKTFIAARAAALTELILSAART